MRPVISQAPRSTNPNIQSARHQTHKKDRNVLVIKSHMITTSVMLVFEPMYCMLSTVASGVSGYLFPLHPQRVIVSGKRGLLEETTFFPSAIHYT